MITKNITATIAAATLVTAFSIVPALADNENLLNQMFAGPSDAVTESGNEAPDTSDSQSEADNGFLSWTPYIAPQPKSDQELRTIVLPQIPELQVVDYGSSK